MNILLGVLVYSLILALILRRAFRNSPRFAEADHIECFFRVGRQWYAHLRGETVEQAIARQEAELVEMSGEAPAVVVITKERAS